MMFFPYYPPFLSVMAVIAPGFMVSLPNIRAVSGDAAFRYCRSSCLIGMEDSPIGHSASCFICSLRGIISLSEKYRFHYYNTVYFRFQYEFMAEFLDYLHLILAIFQTMRYSLYKR